MPPLQGIHHVTAIASDPQKNLDFYSGLLGLRLVKKTVNFDDPGSYHLYYGDRAGSPGSIVTFFSWPSAAPGRIGAGEPVAFGLAIPPGSLDWWRARLEAAGFHPVDAGIRQGEPILSVADPDNLKVELVEHLPSTASPGRTSFWAEGPIPEQYAVTAIHSVTLSHRSKTPESADLFQNLTFTSVASDAATLRRRFSVGAGSSEGFIDVVPAAAPGRGRMGAGTIHHVAFRTDDDGSQIDWQQSLLTLGLHVSPVMDRNYFHSIYFREPGGVLFEIATDPPGFAIDEPETHLGESLKLPSWYESIRSELETSLPRLVTPKGGA
ncbi:MAG: ring-cleaving dioxygenase [Bryobacteraceae bacterium]